MLGQFFDAIRNCALSKFYKYGRVHKTVPEAQLQGADLKNLKNEEENEILKRGGNNKLKGTAPSKGRAGRDFSSSNSQRQKKDASRGRSPSSDLQFGSRTAAGTRETSDLFVLRAGTFRRQASGQHYGFKLVTLIFFFLLPVVCSTGVGSRFSFTPFHEVS